MARYDDIVEQNKKYLTQAQIQALANASTQYNAQNAGKRAGALATAREQYDTGYRGLQNMGLAGAGQPMSGEVPRLEREIRTPFEDYNQRLQDVEHMRLSALGAGMAQQTQAEMAAEAERQRQAAEEARRQAEYQRAVAAAQALVTKVKNSVTPSWLQKTTDAVKSVAAKAAAKAQNDGMKRTEQLKQQAQQQTVAAANKYQQDGMNRTVRPQDVAAAALYNVAHYTSTPAVESANAAQEKGIKLTEKLKGAVDTTNANKYFVGPNKTTFTQAEADADLKSAQQEYDNLRWKQHYGGKVSKEEMASAQDAVAMAKLKAEKPETYSALAIYNDPAYKGSKQYDNAVGIIAEEEAKALVKQTYGRDIDTSMTYDQFEKTGKDIRQLKDLLKRYDYAEKTLKLAKDQKMSEATIAEDQALVDSVVADLEKMGYSVEKARDTAENYTSDRDARAEIEYYKNALSAVMKNEGKTPTKPVNEKEIDPTYRAVNGLPDIGDNSQVLVPGRLPTPTWQGIKKDFTSVAHMSEAEKNAYNAIYEREGIKAANAYAEAIRPLTNIQRAKDDEDYAKELANDQVATTILANLGSVPIRAAGSIPAALEKYIVGGLNTLSDMYTGGAGVPKYIDTNSSAHQLSNFASSIRSETSKRIIESNSDNPVLGQWANKAYGLGMSMADSAFNMAFGIAVAPWVTGLLAGSDAANEAYKDARARGGTQQQAMAVATAAGIAENLFETVSLEYFTKQWIEKGAAWTRPFWVKLGLGAGVEGSEEVFTSTSNLLSDIYFMKDKSEWQEIVDKHGPEGLKDAIFEEMGNLGADFLGGAISGGVFGLFGGAYNGAVNYAETTRIGKQAESLGLVEKYSDMAKVLGGKAGNTAAQVESKQTAHKVGKMVNQVNKQLSSAFTGNEKTDIPMALMFSGKQLSFTEANDVYQALGAETLEKMGYATDSARSFMESYNKRMVDTGIFARTQERLKESSANRANVEAEEYLTMTDQLGGTEYNEKNVALQKSMREALEKRVWKNPNAGIVVTDTGEEIAAMPGSMTRVGWAEMNRKNFKAQSTVTKGRTTYELSSMAMREGMTNDESYAAMRDNMQDAAKKSADFYEKLADTLGLDIVVHDVMRGSNGFLKDGKLHVVLSSRQNATRIASHELTHYMKAHSPEKFSKLMGNLIREVGQREFDRQVAAKAAFYGFDTNSRSGLANAREEVCAELCERMLSNEDMLARFAQRETDTARAMKSHLQQTVEAIRNALTGDENRDFGNSNSSMIKAAETMDSWIDGLTDAIANAEAQKKTMMGQVAITAGVTETDHNRLVDALSDTKTEEEFDDVFTEFSVDIIEYDLAGYMQDLKTVMNADEINELYETMTAAINEVKTHRSLLDFGEEYGTEGDILQAKKDRRFSPYKKNSDPHYKVALDFSTLCRKRVLLQAIQERLQAKLQRALSQEEIVAIRLELQKLQKENYSVEVACALCYVEAARLKTGENINKFLRNTEAEMRNYFAKKSATTKAMVAEYQQDWKQRHGYAENATKDQMSGADVEAFNEASRKYREKIGGSSEEEKRIIAKAVELAKEHPEVYLAQTQLDYLHKQDPNKYLSPKQLHDLMTEYPDIFAALAEKVVSAARAKAQETDTFYSRGDIARVSTAVIAAANLESGFRHQSWSDFVPKHLLDTMAAIIEMSTVKYKDKITGDELTGAKMHAYTKVPAMVEFLGNTGMMLNMSLIPAGNGIDPKTGKLIWDSVEGIDWNVMMDLRRDFADTAGNIAIGVSNEQIRLLLDSPDIDYVIPYHASGMNKNMRSYLDIKDWSEYTRSQNEKGDKKQFPGLYEWFDEEAAAKAEDGYTFMQQASEKYLRLCAKRHLKPKFAQYLHNNGDGSYSLRDDYKNYWKLLIDRKMVNQKTGKVIIQQAVKPNFNKETVMQILRNPVNEVLSNDAEKAADKVTAEFSNWLPNRNNASAEAIQETKNLLKDLEKNGPVMHSVDSEDEQGYNVDGYRAYMTPEAIERYSKDPRFANYKYKDLAYIAAASFNGVNFDPQVLLSIPKIAEAQRNIEQQKTDTLTQFPYGKSPKRDAMRQSLVDRMLSPEYGSAVFENGKLKKEGKKGVYNGPVARERRAAIVIGRPAGGKSTVYADPLSNSLKARIMDSDTIKEWLPEYADGDGASVVHEESSEILKRAMAEAIVRGENLIIPKIGGPSIRRLAEQLRKEGYTLGLYDNEISQETSVTRSSSRFTSTGRWIDMNYLLSIGDKPINTFLDLAESGLFDYAEIRSNEAPGLDAVPEKIWSTGSAEPLNDAIQRYRSGLGRPAAGNATATGGYGYRDGQPRNADRAGKNQEVNNDPMHSINDDEYMDLAELYAAGTATKAQTERLQQMVSDASSQYIEGFILPDDSDEEGFKFHRGPAPTRTFKRYAVLNVTEDGFKAAYAGNRSATPVGPWLDSQNLISYMSDITKFRDGSYATYIKGDTGATASDKFSKELLEEYGLKASQNVLLERGGKHSSDLPNFSQMNLQRDENGNKIEKKYIKSEGVLPHNKLIFEIEYGIREGGDLTDYVREHGRIDATGKNQGIAKIGPNQYYDFKTNPNAVGNWGIGGTFRIRRLVTMEEVQRVTAEYKKNAIENAKKQYADGKISKADMKKQIAGAEAITTQKWEGGLHPEDFGLTVESVDQMFQNGKKMKLGDLVTYDDNGKIIPLSQRFNPDVEDARYSIEDEPAQYSAESIEQISGVAEFLDKVSGGDARLREQLLTALLPVIEQNVASIEKRAANRVQKAQTRREPGMKPAGREPRVRDVRVPQYAKTGNPVSDFVRSFLESDKATDEMVADLMDKIANGEWGSYTRLTNVEAMNAARDFVANRTLSKAQQEFHDMVKSGRYNVQTRAIGLQLLAEAAQRGDAEQVLNIATDLRELATDAGQSVQIFSVLKELGGVGSAWYMQKKIDALNAKYQDKISAGKMNEITIDADLMQDLIEAKTTAEIEAAEDEIAKAIAKQLPLTWESRISNWRYLAMLANPTTHFRNLTGNFFMKTMNTTKDAVAAGIERLAVRDISKRAHAVLTLNDKRTWGDYAERNYADQEKVLRGNGKFGFETQLRQYMRAFDTKWLNKIAQFNFNALENEDMWFIKPAYKNALMQYMKAQGYTLQDGVAGKMVKGEFKAMTKEQLNAAQEWAAQQAWKATFHDASVLATILNNASKKLGPVGNVLIEGVMPFKKTPINIARRGIEYSPAGIVIGAVQLAKDVKTGKVTTAAAIDNIASGITGSTLMAVGAILAKMGLLRSGGEDKKKHETYLSDTGDQTYALKIGGVSIGLSALAPATIPLFMGAALYDALDKHGEGLDLSALTETAANTLNPFMEMSFMSSLNSALKSYSNDGIGGALGNTLLTAAESYGSQFLPTVVAKAGQVFDPINRTTKSSAASKVGSGLDYYARSLAKKVPGLEATLQPDVDVWGRTTNTMDSFGKWALDFANKFIFPANVRIANKTAIDDELIRVVESTGNVDILPSDGPKYFTVKGEKYPMTAAQYTEYSIDRGQASYVALKETMLSDAYKSSTDEARADMLKNALSAAQKQVSDVWKEKLGAVEPVTAEPVKEQTEVKATQGDYSDPALYKVAASYPKAYDKAAKAKAKGISPDTFLSIYEKKDTYSGEDLTKYTRQEIMKSNLSVKQKEFMDDLIVSDKGYNPDYSSQAWFDVSMLGKSKYDEAKMGAQVGLKPETYYKVYTKWKTLDAKDANGKTVNGLKKKRAKEYLDSLTLSGPEYSFIWTVMFGY